MNNKNSTFLSILNLSILNFSISKHGISKFCEGNSAVKQLLRLLPGRLMLLIALVMSINTNIYAQNTQHVAIQNFISLTQGPSIARQQAINAIAKNWHDSYTPIVLESLTFIRESKLQQSLIELLEKQTGKHFGYDLNSWYEWIWSLEYQPHPDYALFKSSVYKRIDPAFADYFDDQPAANIRLDEIRWGGVAQDGIPPLRQPTMIGAEQADYLADSDIIFGIEINGDSRAYPRRILAWHEMFVDDVGGVSIVGVYCTLCGTVIIYDNAVDGVKYEMGTSGFLYRSNKLMYDQATQSLWTTFKGSPAVGPLVNQGIQFKHRYIVTTTWGEWKKRHPDSQVLSLNTGYRRNYDEGVAYQAYFATDELMFTVPNLDKRLKNKDEILGIVLNQNPATPLAIAVDFLAKNTIYHDKIGSTEFVALTDRSGAIRVYETSGQTFTQWDQARAAVDSNGVAWVLSESSLKSENGETLSRLPANRAFWFGWYSAYSHTRLVH